MGSVEETGRRGGGAWLAYVTVLAFAAFPCLQLLAGNAGEVDLPRLALWWLAISGVAASIVGLAHIWGHANRCAVFVSLVLYLGFLAPEITALQGVLGPEHSETTLGWLIVTLIVLTFAVPLSRRRPVQLFLALASLGLVAVSALPLVGLPSAQTLTLASGSSSLQQPEATPNIWILVPDGYSGPGVLEERTGLDLDPWFDDLRDRGFEVAEQARANYPTTWASLPAMLEMEYVLDEDDRLGDLQPLFDRVRGDNATVRTLKRWGYRYVHSAGVSWEGARCGGYEDRCIGRSGLTETDWALLRMTPLAGLLEKRFYTDVANYSNPASVTQLVLKNEPTAPYVVLQHLLSPHPPFVRDSDCNVRRDVPDYEKGRPQLYRGMVECLNQQLLTAIDAILEVDEQAVIVIQSDHGHDWGLKWGDPHDPAWTSEAGRDRWPTLAALRLPDGCSVPNDLSPVNTMRLVTACLAGESPDLLPYRAWITTYHPEVVPRPHGAP